MSVGASQVVQWVKNPPAMQEMQEMQFLSLGWDDPLEEDMATHSSVLAWRIPWTEEPGRPQSTGCKELGTTDGDCSHEIKRRLLLGRKVMTNLDSMLKSRDITLPTKVCLVKAMVFPVVMYGCESWTVKKAER